MRTTAFAIVVILSACTTSAEEADPANRGNIVYSLSGDSLETSRTGEYSSTGGESNLPLLVLAHAGSATALRAAQSGSGSAAQLVAANATEEAPALRVESAGSGPAARFTGGRVVVGEGGTLVLASIARVRAGDQIAAPGGAAVVHVERTDGGQANELTVPSPAEGQVLVVVNDDDDPVAIGDARVPAGETRQLLCVGGRFRALGGAPAAAPEPAPAQ